MALTTRESDRSGEAGVNVAACLNHLGLEQYEQAFRENDVDAEVLPELTAEDLIGLGVTSIGHRRELLAAIAALRAKPPPASEKTGPITASGRQEAPGDFASSSAERRQLTVMFCDLVGSTALSSRLDPEDLREVIATYHRAVAEIVTRLDGFVSRYMGDGVLVYFGYPQAHEDDAERTVRAGLDATDAVGRLNVKSVKLEARVGIATGLVVVGDLIGEGSAQEQSVVGNAEPRRAFASIGRGGFCRDRRWDEATGRRSLRVPRSRRRRGERHPPASGGLAGAAAERRR
jgi:class 3 adenylate cyclase